ncbi:transport protein particle complex subunit [Encephalitozoon intestinalis ATCC 50506]|uniref:Transport protein particle complex subunit n=1 Tax=Encephalitozoon intestinalis (strain ATCC 50506) TaxID=876142 RepID=E0S9Z8_ENCIT|nr:transport protein particle complex subunit [Encephalitozoon intestinalis ATCC 50506]ADM12620.1 transport protein particle complex subunit [Encephalitozoon intestinalis ATCC 50506]UTX46479.1 BET3-like protein [Encephalitozoon intestinalis]
MSYLICGIVEYLLEQKKDVEASLKTIGYEIGIKLLEVCNFEREVHIPTLLYRIAFDFLSLVGDSDKRIDKSEDSDKTYFLTDADGVLSRFMSVPTEWDGFSADSVVCGMIEAVLMASGYRSEVTAFPKPSESLSNRVIFQINILDP